MLTLLDSGLISIILLELKAVFMAIKKLIYLLRGKVVQLLTNSKTVVSYVLHQGSCVLDLMELMIHLLEFYLEDEITLL